MVNNFTIIASHSSRLVPVGSFYENANSQTVNRQDQSKLRKGESYFAVQVSDTTILKDDLLARYRKNKTLKLRLFTFYVSLHITFA